MHDANPNAARMIVTTRIFEAPRALVFDAFSDPGHLARWWGPNGFRTTTSAFEFRVGGVWRFVMHGPDGRDYPNCITFKQISAPQRLAYHHGDGQEVEAISFENVLTFEDLGGRTRLTMEATFPNAELRERVAREHHAVEGAVQHLTRLGEFLQADVFTISRRFAAPRALLWKLWTEEEHLARWWGPKGFEWLSGTLDLRPGGIFHYGMKSPDGKEMWGRFVFHEIAAPERLCFVNSFSDPQGSITRAPFFANWPLEVFNVMTLAEDGDGTVLTLRGAPINASEDERARYRSHHASMQAGFGASMDALEAYLQEVG
ncbi:MAG: SRPBCC family protein [Rhizomicrobium sp.]|nr:SRPBCC family protein [Rhizomicrobium sp.]